MSVHVAPLPHTDDSIWRLSVNGVTVTGSGRLRRRETRRLQAIFAAMLTDARRDSRD